MVTRLKGVPAAALLVVALTGCPDDLGKNLRSASPVERPTNLVATANGGLEIRLSWSDNATGELGYRLEMCHQDFHSSTPEFRILAPNTSFVAFAAIPRTPYRFRVFAITDALESEPSNEATVFTPAAVDPPPWVRASSEDPTQAVVSWGDVRGESGYTVQISADDGSTWSTVAFAGVDQTSAVVPGLTSDAEYLFRVHAVHPYGLSDPSTEIGVVTLTRSMSSLHVSWSDCGRGLSFGLFPTGAILICSYDATASHLAIHVELGYQPGGGIYTGGPIDSGPTGQENVGADGSSIALDGAGKAHVVAHDLTNNTLRYTTGLPGPTTATTIDPGPGGAKPRIAWNPVNGALHAVYQVPGTRLKHLVKPAGQPWGSPEILNTEIDASSMHALAVDTMGTVHVVLINSRKELVYGVKPLATGVWAFQTLPLTSQTMRPDSVSMALDATRTPHFAIYDGTGGALYHLTRIAGTWEMEVVDRTPGADVGGGPSLAIDRTSGRLHVAYYDATRGDLRYARKDGGGRWTRRLIDAVGDVGTNASIALTASGAVAIAYRDETQRRAKLARGTP